VGGYGLDAVWNDDFHHSAVVALTGNNEAYYTDYLGSPQELLSAIKHGYLYQGQWYEWQKKRRGSPTKGLPARAFVGYLENHDQVANSGTGERLWRQTAPGQHRAMTALLLLGPWTPLLFQGQEWNSSAPFTFFADHHAELRALVRKGRADFLGQFPRSATPEIRDKLLDPGAAETVSACRLDWSEPARGLHQQSLALHRDLLAVRRSDPVIAAQGDHGVQLDGAVLGPECFVLRHSTASSDDRLLLVNLGRDLCLRPAPEPLLAPPEGKRWSVLWSSESTRYGGAGTPEPDQDGWRIPGHAALLLAGVA
jgi:maltooligosyltrehalose trehalohydrolase